MVKNENRREKSLDKELSSLPGGTEGLLELSLQLADPVVGHLQLQLAHLESVPGVGDLQLGLVHFAGGVAEHLLAGGVQRGLLAETLLGQVDHLFGSSMDGLGLLVAGGSLLRLLSQLGGVDAGLVVGLGGVDRVSQFVGGGLDPHHALRQQALELALGLLWEMGSWDFRFENRVNVRWGKSIVATYVELHLVPIDVVRCRVQLLQLHLRFAMGLAGLSRQ